MKRLARAGVVPVRQRTQYSCVATSLTMCLRSHGVDCTEDEVANVMGCKPMQGASWEDCIAAAQHYGMKASLVCPCSVEELKAKTDEGVPAIIGWNPEGRDWSHASVVFDVSPDLSTVYVADPNIPDPSQTVREVPRQDFYKAWVEKWPRYLVRRPAVFIEREISPEGRPMFASMRRRDMKLLSSEQVRIKLEKERVRLGCECDGSCGPEHEGRFKECPTEDPCMTVDEVAAVVGPKFKQKSKNPPPLPKGKKRKAASPTVHVESVGRDVVIYGDYGETDPQSPRSALSFLLGLLQIDKDTIIMGGNFSLGPYQTAMGTSYAVLDRRGDVIDEARDPRALLRKYFVKL